MCMNVLHLNMQILLVHLTSTPTSICSNWSSLGRQRDWRSTILRRHRQELPAKPSCSVAAGRGPNTHPESEKKLGDGTQGPRNHFSGPKRFMAHYISIIYRVICTYFIPQIMKIHSIWIRQHGISKKENTPTVWHSNKALWIHSS